VSIHGESWVVVVAAVVSFRGFLFSSFIPSRSPSSSFSHLFPSGTARTWRQTGMVHIFIFIVWTLPFFILFSIWFFRRRDT
jgi:hypothetical protein